jgi:drug/metabolite transporter (DMT)-like permease
LDGVLRTNLYELPALSIVFVEHLVGLVLILPFVWRGFRPKNLQGRDWLLMFLIALFSGLLGTLWFTKALLLGAFGTTFLLQKLQPVFVTLGSVIFLKDHLRFQFVVWATVAFVSAYFVSFPMGKVDFSGSSWWAALYAVGAAAAWGSSTVLSKLFLKKHSYEKATAYRFGITTILAGLGLLVLGDWVALSEITWPQFGQFLIIALSSGMIALLIYYRGLAGTRAQLSAFLELSFPLFAMLIDWFWFDKSLQISQYLAGGVLMVSFLFLARQNHFEQH